MMKQNAYTGDKEAVWFVYDGQCPLCLMGATHFKVKEAVGTLHLLDARENPDHPIMQEISRLQLNLDQGMVIKFKDTCFQGADALHVMALLGTNTGWFNRINARLFKSKQLSTLLYPLFRTTRNALLMLKGVRQINNLEHFHD